MDSSFRFDNPENLESAYKLNSKQFMKKLRKLYNPMRYKGDKEEDQKIHLIMQEISMKLNSLNWDGRFNSIKKCQYIINKWFKNVNLFYFE